MRYLDRKRLGIEYYLATRSAVFSRQNELTPDELITRLRAQPYQTRYRVASDVQKAVRELMSSQYDVARLIPQNVAEISDPLTAAERVSKLRPFFVWLISLWRDNDHSRSQWLSQMKTVARTFEDSAGDCLVALGIGNNQRALFVLEEDQSLTMSLHERKWGHMTMRFPNCQLMEGNKTSLGFIYLLEAEQLEDGRYKFDLLIDTDFGILQGDTRAMYSAGWTTLTFTSDAPQITLHSLDVLKAMRLRGMTRIDAVRAVGSVLAEKESMLGEGFLTSSERAVRQLAKFVTLTKQLADSGKEPNYRCEAELLSLFANRYLMEQIAAVFEREKAPEFARLIEEIIEHTENENDERALYCAVKLSKRLDEGAACGTLTALINRLEQMLDCFEETGCDGRESVYRTAAKAFADAVEPMLKKLRFEGTYPNYRRVRGKKVDFITAVTLDEPDNEDEGCMAYRFTLSLARVKGVKDGKLRGVDISQLGVPDFDKETLPTAQVGRLDCAAAPDCVKVEVSITDNKVSPIDTAPITKMLRLAKRALRGVPLKRKERRSRKTIGQKNGKGAWFRAFSRFAPLSSLMCAVTAAAYLIARTRIDFVADMSLRTACIPIAFSGLITAAAAAGIYCLYRSRRLWKY